MNEVCPSCGSFTNYLGEQTGWCRCCESVFNVKPAKPCAACGMTKPLTDFGPHPEKRDGLRCSCRECETARRRRWRHEHIERERATWTRSYARRKIARAGNQPSPSPTLIEQIA